MPKLLFVIAGKILSQLAVAAPCEARTTRRALRVCFLFSYNP